jgi:hypothetical protein
MNDQRAAGQHALSTTDITTYVGGLVLGLALTHLVIAVIGDGRVSTPGTLALAAVAIFIAAFMYVRRAAIAQRRYAQYLLHVLAYVMVNASFLLHALVMYAAGRAGEVADTWRGVLFAMPLIWAIGLFLHTLGIASSKGYDHVEV